MSNEKSNRERVLHDILHNWDGYDVEISARENLIELIIHLGYRDEALVLLQRYRRRRHQ